MNGKKKKYLFNENVGPFVENLTSGTIIVMDGTGSMSSLLHKSKQAVYITFERAFDTLNVSKYFIEQNYSN